MKKKKIIKFEFVMNDEKIKVKNRRKKLKYFLVYRFFEFHFSE